MYILKGPKHMYKRSRVREVSKEREKKKKSFSSACQRHRVPPWNAIPPILLHLSLRHLNPLDRDCHVFDMSDSPFAMRNLVYCPLSIKVEEFAKPCQGSDVRAVERHDNMKLMACRQGCGGGLDNIDTSTAVWCRANANDNKVVENGVNVLRSRESWGDWHAGKVGWMMLLCNGR